MVLNLGAKAGIIAIEEVILKLVELKQENRGLDDRHNLHWVPVLVSIVMNPAGTGRNYSR